MSETPESFDMEFKTWPEEGARVGDMVEQHSVLRQVGLGMTPLILIEPEMDEDENVRFKVQLSLLDHEDALDVLELVVMGLKQGIEQREKEQD